jgi:hypothetical protein
LSTVRKLNQNTPSPDSTSTDKDELKEFLTWLLNPLGSHDFETSGSIVLDISKELSTIGLAPTVDGTSMREGKLLISYVLFIPLFIDANCSNHMLNSAIHWMACQSYKNLSTTL